MAHLEAVKRNWFGDLCHRSSGPLLTPLFEVNPGFPLSPFVVRSVHSWASDSESTQTVLVDELFLVNLTHTTLSNISASFKKRRLPISRTLPPLSFAREVLLNNDEQNIGSLPTISLNPLLLRNKSIQENQCEFILEINSNYSTEQFFSVIVWMPNAIQLCSRYLDDVPFVAQSVGCTRNGVYGRRITISSFDKFQELDNVELFRQLPLSLNLVVDFESKASELQCFVTVITANLTEFNLPETIIGLSDQILPYKQFSIHQTDQTFDLISSHYGLSQSPPNLVKLHCPNYYLFSIGQVYPKNEGVNVCNVQSSLSKKIKNILQVQKNDHEVLNIQGHSQAKDILLESRNSNYLFFITTLSGVSQIPQLQCDFPTLFLFKVPNTINVNRLKPLTHLKKTNGLFGENAKLNKKKDPSLPGIQLRSRYVCKTPEKARKKKRRGPQVKSEVDDNLYCDLAVLPMVIKEEPSDLCEEPAIPFHEMNSKTVENHPESILITDFNQLDKSQEGPSSTSNSLSGHVNKPIAPRIIDDQTIAIGVRGTACNSKMVQFNEPITVAEIMKIVKVIEKHRGSKIDTRFRFGEVL
ncbi:hypothetical protein P9112_007701 [Eukaryota sp. TZLM1-RC]